MPFYRNNTSNQSESSSLQTDGISEPRSSAVEPSSIPDTNNSVIQNYEIFISPISGDEFEIIKDPINETKTYRDQTGTVFDDKDELLNYEIEKLSISPNLLKLDAKLREIAESGDANGSVPVIIAFVEQPAHNVSIEVQAMYEPVFEEITAPAKVVYKRIEPMMIAADEDSDFIALEQELLTEEEKDLLNETASRLDQETMQMRRDIYERSAPLVEEIQALVVEKIQANGGEVGYRGKSFNSIAARIPVNYLPELSKDLSISLIAYEKTYNVTLDTSNKGIYAETWWNQGYTGGGLLAAVVDTGIDATHPNLMNYVYNSGVFLDSAMKKTWTVEKPWTYNEPNPPTTDDIIGHGTHCAGIIASQHATFKGTAYGGGLINAKAGYLGTDLNAHLEESDIMNAIDWAILQGADVISCSFGGGHGSDGDTLLCWYMDAITFIYNIPFAVAAGNVHPKDPINTKYVTSPGSAYNVVTVGNVDNRDSITRSDDIMHSSSCIGPTGDGRIKPDISAPGTEIKSCNNNWEGSQDDFRLDTGTSMATPHVAGSTLLIRSYVGIQWDAKAIKSLLLNTASYMGAGWDYNSGWGYIDLNRAYTRRGNVHTGSLADMPEGTSEKYYKGPVYSGDKATLVWNRQYNDPYFVLTDLDLYITPLQNVIFETRLKSFK